MTAAFFLSLCLCRRKLKSVVVVPQCRSDHWSRQVRLSSTGNMPIDGTSLFNIESHNVIFRRCLFGGYEVAHLSGRVKLHVGAETAPVQSSGWTRKHVTASSSVQGSQACRCTAFLMQHDEVDTSPQVCLTQQQVSQTPQQCPELRQVSPRDRSTKQKPCLALAWTRADGYRCLHE